MGSACSVSGRRHRGRSPGYRSRHSSLRRELPVDAREPTSQPCGPDATQPRQCLTTRHGGHSTQISQAVKAFFAGHHGRVFGHVPRSVWTCPHEGASRGDDVPGPTPGRVTLWSSLQPRPLGSFSLITEHGWIVGSVPPRKGTATARYLVLLERVPLHAGHPTRGDLSEMPEN